MGPANVVTRFGNWCSEFRASLHSKQAFLRFLETTESRMSENEERNKWSNKDLDISPPEDWTWAWWDYAAFWWSYGFSVGVWSLGSSMMSLGLNYWQAIICVFLGHTLGAIGVVLHSRSAARYHFGFPVESRVAWGMIGAYFAVIVRVMVGTIWNGLSIIQGGYFMAILIRCIFGKRFYEMHSPIPTSSGITAQELIGMLIYFTLTLPILWIRPSKVKVIFSIKSVVLPPVALGLFIFCMIQGKVKPPGSFVGYKTLHGSTLGWGMMSAINSCMGKTASLIVNQPDLARYAKTPSAPVLSQLTALIVGNTFCATLGIFATSAIQNSWGKLTWNPWDLCNLILTHEWNAGARTGIALVAMGFMLSVFASNLGANAIPWGADTSILLPRFINLRRGVYISYVIAICICPWHILKNSATFLRFLGGYSVFLGPLVGISITDYFVVRRGNIFVPDLYSSDRKGRYWGIYGISWRAVVAYLIAVILPIPGFTTLFGQKFPGSDAWLKIYYLGWLIGCVLSSIVYFLLSKVGDFCAEEGKMGFEEVADNQLLEGLSQGVGSGSDIEAGKIAIGR
ncbi:permease for cytosine/purines, uracil, thiamine, allantoin-domain-containing protein [Tricladium varicosporioides]|nr:permease for cytosine/purines, uracil, thiamine, allantoin-domain-containing protein [Hymenoscyphus varicosporioides]